LSIRLILPDETMQSALKWKVVLLLVSILTAVLFAWGMLKLTVRAMGIRDPVFVYENRLGMWEKDERTGFSNKKNFSAVCWGNIPARTDSNGFRAVSTPLTRGAGTEKPFTVAGVGDSVMWGTAVGEEDSFLGLLRSRLQSERPVQTINSGVVGYSTVQEMLLLESRILGLAPDVVLVNFCYNDQLPTEDPFGNARDVCIRYLQNVEPEQGGEWPVQEKVWLAGLRRSLRTVPGVWSWIEKTPPEQKSFYRHILINLPFRAMDRACRAQGARFVVVFIPWPGRMEEYRAMAGEVKPFLSANGIEFVDLTEELASDGREEVLMPGKVSPIREGFLVRELDLIARTRGVANAHRKNLFIDGIHPTRRGNAIIAGRLADCLLSTQDHPEPGLDCRDPDL
jgi:lysophospholipase L1-like esterase